ncbi:TetR/AcrR family transcriptional regulator [Streptomyces purpurogeneiscleroticus]|uniref:TetR/AcrR family transcriptional regulator n=1 Tax=Streptomyces purpurogeneiscleroticus TaxID=68259 RepID=UPI001CC0B607|nr:helix-turn-helix domain-containing protein [Streptomyces purpurogeneiscleroticus]MBZ4014227.1 TetR family transcriptional regulator [Streptomyces purpurogeneiscleroticus]
MHMQSSHWPAAVASVPGDRTGGVGEAGVPGRTTPLRVDAQRNLEHVLRAAREVFGELGYGAPMEDVARRARVGVGTVYRRFPSKDVLVRRIAEEETARLTDQARTALGQEDDPWSALSRFLRTSVASGAGRLLPPSILRVGSGVDGADGLTGARVPQQRSAPEPAVAPGELRIVAQRTSPDEESAQQHSNGQAPDGPVADSGGAQALLDVVGQLVERAREAGELRADVTVSDVLLVIATGAPSLPDAAQQQAASARLLEILLEGLRSRPVA